MPQENHAAGTDPINQRIASFRTGFHDVPAVMLGMVRPIQPGAADVYYDIRSYGTIPFNASATDKRRPPTPTTIFEIGSVTKTFTGTALAWLASRGSVSISGPAQDLLPAAGHGGVTLPEWTPTSGPAVAMTCADLADFTAGFPADGSGGAIPGGLDHQQLFHYLNTHPGILTFAPGSQYAYADAAFELLGSALSYANQQNYTYAKLLADLLHAGGLLMPDTVITLSPEQHQRVAVGLQSDGTAAHFRPGEWLIQSTMSDMMVWLTFNMGLLPDCPLNGLLPLVQQKRFTQPADQRAGLQPGTSTGLGWFIEPLVEPAPPGTATRIAKDGGTPNGFSSYICFMQGGSTGLVLLTNLDKTRLPELGNQLLEYITSCA